MALVIRERKKVNIRYPDGDEWFPISDIPIKQGETKVVGRVWLAKSSPFDSTWLLLHWEASEDDAWLLVPAHTGTRTILRLYPKRAWIEAMYGDMNSRGFDWEKSRL